MLTKGAIGNLINRYNAVLKKCRILNTFGSLALAAALAGGMTSPALAAGSIVNTDTTITEDTTITADTTTENSSRYAGIIADTGDTTVTVQDGATLTLTNNADSSASRFYGAATQTGSSLTINGNVSASLNGADSQEVRVFRANGGDMIINGDVHSVAKGTSGTVISAEAWFGADMTFTGGETYLEAVSTGGRVIAVQNFHQSSTMSTMNFLADKTTILAQNSADSENYTQGVLAYQSETNFTGDTDIIVRGGLAETYGVDVQCDPGNAYDTVVNFSGKHTLVDATAEDVVYAVRPSGVPGSINFTGETVTLRATSSIGEAAGIRSQYGAHLNSQAAMDITAKSASGSAYGIILTNYADYAGNATFDNTLSINASSEEGNAFGIYNSTQEATKDLENNGHLQASRGVTITATSSQGDALGLYSDGEYARNALSGNVNITTTAEKGNSFGVLAQNGASVALGSNGSSNTITATGVDSTALALDGTSSLTLSGSTMLSADKALAGEGVVTNQGDLAVAKGTVSDFTGNYVQKAGSTLLSRDSGFFGGDVNIEQGALAVNMDDMGGVQAANDKAMLALGRSITVADGKTLTVGTVEGESDAAVAFGADSVLVVDGKAASQAAMIRSENGGSVAVEEGSTLYIANAQVGEAYTITEGLETTEGEYWNSANLLGNRLTEGEITLDGDKILVSMEAKDAATVLPGVIPVRSLNTMMNNGLNDTESASAGIRFLSRAMDQTFVSSDSLAAATVNEVSRAAVTAGVQNTALRLADAGADQIAQHLSLSFFNKESNIHADGLDVWATPMYGNTYSHGMAASGASVRGNYGGLALGADTQVGEMLGGKVRVGASVHGGGGKSETRGTATDTENSYNFGGVNLYAGWNLDNLNIMASVGYAMADHDVEMNLPASMGMNRADADVDTSAFIADLRAEYMISTPVVDILPHAGVRYTALHTDSYDLKVNGSTLNSASSDTQHIVQFPVGVTVTRDIDVSGWTVKPQADVSVIPAAGEKKNTTRVSWAGINAFDSVNTRIMDSTSWSGMVGLQAEKGNLALGLNYGVQASRHETDQRVNVGISWKF